MMSQADDAELVERARALDRDAFAELYERYFDRVYDFLARMMRDRDEAADVAQETFLRAMNSLGSLQTGASFKSWIFTIARNQALNRLERAGRTVPLGGRAGEDDDALEFDLPDVSALANPAAAAEANELAAIVWEAASALDAKQYSLLDLHVRQGLESAEIAEVLGVTKNNAYVMVNRLKQAVSEAVGALVLFRSGRGRCGELDGILARLESGAMSPQARKAIDKHAAHCEACAERRRQTLPLAAFGGLALVRPPSDAKAHILDALMQSWPPAGTAATSAGSVASGGAGEAAQGWAGSGGGANGNDGGETGAAGAGGRPGWHRARRGGVLLAGAAAVLFVALFGAISVLGGGEDTSAASTGKDGGEPATLAANSNGATATPTATSTATVTATAPSTAAAQGGATEPPLTDATKEPGAATVLPPSGPSTPSAAPETPSPLPLNPGVTPPTVTPAPPTVAPPASVTVTPPVVTVTPTPVTPTATPVTPTATAVTPAPVVCDRRISVAPSSVTINGSGGQATFVVTDTSVGCTTAMAMTVTPATNWMTVTPSTAILPRGGSVTVVVRINQSAVPTGARTARITIAAGGETAIVTVTYQPGSDGPGGGPGGFTS